MQGFVTALVPALHAAAGIILAVVGVELMPQTLQVEPVWIIVLCFVAAGQAKTEIGRNLAWSMAEAQLYEIDYMQQLSQEKGYDLAPETPLMDMSHQEQGG